jgi:uncharacterized lipoprotein YajG
MKKLYLLIAVLVMTGCASQTFNINGSEGDVPTIQKSHTFYISGLGQAKVLDAAEVCGGAEKVVKVEAQHTFINGLLGLITIGIYTPRDAKVYCAG